MFNPYLLLGALIFLLVACAGSYFKGYKNAENAAAAKHAVALEEQIKQSREAAAIDTKAAVAAEAKRQKSRVEFKDRVVTVKEYINAKPIPAECVIPDNAVRLLNDIIRNANDPTAAAKPVPVPPATPPARRKPDDDNAGVLIDYRGV